MNRYNKNRIITNYRNSRFISLVLSLIYLLFLFQNTYFPGITEEFWKNLYSLTYIFIIFLCLTYIASSTLIYTRKRLSVLNALTAGFFFTILCSFIFMNTLDLIYSNDLLAYSIGIISISYIYRIKNLFLVISVLFFTVVMSIILLMIKTLNSNSIFLVFQVIIYSATALIFGILNNLNHRKMHKSEEISLEKTKNLENSQRKMQRDLSLAVQVQQRLLPENPENLKNFEAASYHKSSTGISGDFYDFYIKENQLTGVSLFDVSGHGIAAGLLTMLAKPLIYRNITRNENLPLNEVMKKIDSDLSLELHGMFQYLTGVLMRFSGNTVQYVNAAHTEIIYYSSKTGSFRGITPDESEDGNTILGVDFINLNFTEINFELEPGDYIIYFTDGLIDITNSRREHYTMQKLLELLPSMDFSGRPQNIVETIIKDITVFSENTVQEDDITLIALKKK